MDGLAHLRWHWGIGSGWKMYCMGSAAQMCLRRGSTDRVSSTGERREEANTTEGLEYWSSQLNSRMFVSSRVVAASHSHEEVGIVFCRRNAIVRPRKKEVTWIGRERRFTPGSIVLMVVPFVQVSNSNR
jgi:hypothetical protein